jgi:nicotinamide riboside transporter PnuC
MRRRRGLPKRPYRDSAIFYGALAIVIVVVAVATGGNLLEAILVALAAFILATGWSWWRFRERLEGRGRR